MFWCVHICFHRTAWSWATLWGGHQAPTGSSSAARHRGALLHLAFVERTLVSIGVRVLIAPPIRTPCTGTSGPTTRCWRPTSSCSAVAVWASIPWDPSGVCLGPRHFLHRLVAHCVMPPPHPHHASGCIPHSAIPVHVPTRRTSNAGKGPAQLHVDMVCYHAPAANTHILASQAAMIVCGATWSADSILMRCRAGVHVWDVPRPAVLRLPSKGRLPKRHDHVRWHLPSRDPLLSRDGCLNCVVCFWVPGTTCRTQRRPFPAS